MLRRPQAGLSLKFTRSAEINWWGSRFELDRPTPLGGPAGTGAKRIAGVHGGSPRQESGPTGQPHSIRLPSGLARGSFSITPPCRGATFMPVCVSQKDPRRPPRVALLLSFPNGRRARVGEIAQRLRYFRCFARKKDWRLL